MKKLTAGDHITTSAGFPMKGGTLDFLQEAHQETTAAVVDGLLRDNTADTILYGCIYADDGVNYTVTAGAIYSSGEVFLVDAVGSTALPTGSDLVIYKLVTTQFTDATADPVTYTDAVTYNVHDIRKIVIGTGTSGTSGYIGDFADLLSISEEWTVPTTFGTGWTTTTPQLEYKRRSDGLVSIRGWVISSTSSPSALVFTLPAGYRPPSGKSYTSACVALKSAAYKTTPMSIGSNGEISYLLSSDVPTVTSEGVLLDVNFWSF